MKALAEKPRLSRDNICAVVITYHPSKDMIHRLKLLSSETHHILVVDNGSDVEETEPLKIAAQASEVDLIMNRQNRGIAAALNQGFQYAIELGYPWVLTLDQDSTPKPGMVNELLSVYHRHPHRQQLAILVPRLVDETIQLQARYLRRRWGMFFERIPCQDEWLDDATIVITSGALMRSDVFDELGGFREDFFIDYVDTEYCLRTLRKGYKIVVACRAHLDHRLGNRRRTQFGPLIFYPTFHSPERWFYLGRNRIPMIRAYGRRFPHWLLYDLVAGVYGLSRMLLFEDAKLKKLSAFLRGIYHGLQGRMGKMS
jgi:rhamnosyltransferase